MVSEYSLFPSSFCRDGFAVIFPWYFLHSYVHTFLRGVVTRIYLTREDNLTGVERTSW